ncbi:hypothetical protein Patl1_22910 [Pistacia atlantica]|uniref:Uncharacterized protein n=1 Tax=Pistacia atlantica TaxID=434234 RepID=A0ACC0ZZ72_9ROSI|nr:hypothetical protein Patl1_22910 [Pistacia atlantica]
MSNFDLALAWVTLTILSIFWRGVRLGLYKGDSRESIGMSLMLTPFDFVAAKPKLCLENMTRLCNTKAILKN